MPFQLHTTRFPFFPFLLLHTILLLLLLLLLSNLYHPTTALTPHSSSSLPADYTIFDLSDSLRRDYLLRQDQSQCETLVQPRIVGGRPVTTPRLRNVLVSYRIPKPGGTALCTGTLIAPTWVVTATHCFGDSVGLPGQVRIGGDTVNSGDIAAVEGVAVHPDFRSSPPENDIALIKLKEPYRVETGLYELNTDVGLDEGNARTAGYGVTDLEGINSGLGALRVVDVPIVPFDRCIEMLSNSRFNDPVARREAEVVARGFSARAQICAGKEEGGCDSCKGDSGGPLFIQNKTDDLVLGGIISFGIGCGEASAPGVYTRVANYNDWIAEIQRTGEVSTDGVGIGSGSGFDDPGSLDSTKWRTIIIATASAGAGLIVLVVGGALIFRIRAGRRAAARRRNGVVPPPEFDDDGGHGGDTVNQLGIDRAELGQSVLSPYAVDEPLPPPQFPPPPPPTSPPPAETLATAGHPTATEMSSSYAPQETIPPPPPGSPPLASSVVYNAGPQSLATPPPPPPPIAPGAVYNPRPPQ